MISRDEFSVLLVRTGLKLDDNQFEAARTSYANLRVLTDLVRKPRCRRVESPHVLRLHGTTTLKPCATGDQSSTNEV